MEMTPRLKVLLVILAVVISIAAGISVSNDLRHIVTGFFPMTGPVQEPAYAPSAITNVDGSPGAIYPFVGDDSPAKNYSNATYGFSIDYPQDATIVPKSVYQDWLDFLFPNGILLFTAEMPVPNTTMLDSEVSVEVSTDSLGVSDCLVVPDLEPGGIYINSSATTTIDGVDFLAINLAESHMGQNTNATWYKTIHNNKCYLIATTVSFGRYVDITAEQALLNSMVQRFVFQ